MRHALWLAAHAVAIAISGQALATNDTAWPGLHITVIYVNAVFGQLRARRLMQD